jgi:hypothetical protein
MIGHLQKVGERPSKEIRSLVYSFLNGLILNYVYELQDDTLTIWFGKKEFNNFYRGKFSEDDSFSGA